MRFLGRHTTRMWLAAICFALVALVVISLALVAVSATNRTKPPAATPLSYSVLPRDGRRVLYVG